MRIATLAIVTFVLFLLSFPLYAAQQQYVNLPTREGVNVPSWVITPGKVQASVILFAGGGGKLKISEQGIARQGNFLIRSRMLFAQQNLAVFIPDVPTDTGDLFYIRTNQDHASDIASMIAWLRQKFPAKPVWLIGTSRGTLSVANAAARLPVEKNADGIILSASVTQTGNDGQHALSMIDLHRITLPVLLVHHEYDECYVSPFSDVTELYRELRSAKEKSIRSYRGGVNRGRPCRAKAYHGFNGIESTVVTEMVNWITGRYP